MAKARKIVSEDYEPSLEPRWRKDALRAYHTVEGMGARMGRSLRMKLAS